MNYHLRHHKDHEHLHSAWGNDTFGRVSESIANFMGTPTYLIGQSLATIAWIGFNSMIFMHKIAFDPFPFIFLNLAYSIQAGFAGPFVLCAQIRQAARDKAISEADAKHREELAQQTHAMLDAIHIKLYGTPFEECANENDFQAAADAP